MESLAGGGETRRQRDRLRGARANPPGLVQADQQSRPHRVGHRAPGEFTPGVTGTTWHVLGACVALIQAMCAPRNFERHARGCLIHLAMIDRDLVEPVRRALSQAVDTAEPA